MSVSGTLEGPTAKLEPQDKNGKEFGMDYKYNTIEEALEELRAGKIILKYASITL